jgi:hypothetical protein
MEEFKVIGENTLIDLEFFSSNGDAAFLII